MKRLRRKSVLALAAVSIWACCASLASAEITGAVLAKDVKGTPFQAVDPTTSFPVNQPVIHLLVSVANLPAETKLKTVWVAVDVGAAAPANTKIDESEVRATGDATAHFSLSKPTNGWPPGKYKADIYVNDNLDRSVYFTINAPAAAKPPPTPVSPAPAPQENRAAAQVIGNVIFTPPPGWTVINADPNAVQITSPDFAAGNGFAITLIPGQDYTGDVRTYFDAVWQSFKKSFTVLRSTDMQPISVNGVNAFTASAMLLGPNDRSLYCAMFVMTPGGKRVETISITAADDATLKKNLPVFATFLQNLRFQNLLNSAPKGAVPAPAQPQPAKQRPPPTRPGEVGIEGLYYIVRADVLQPRYVGDVVANMYNQVAADQLFFILPGGHFYSGTLLDGLEGLTEDRMRGQGWERWTWDTQAKQITITDSILGKDRTFKIEGEFLLFRRYTDVVRDKDQVIDRYRRLPRCDGMRIDGAYSERKPENWKQGEPTIILTADGKFRDDGYLFQIHAYLGGNNPYPRGGAGTYEIRNNTIFFHYDGGRTYTKLFHTWPTGATNQPAEDPLRPSQLYIGAWVYRCP